MTTPCTPNRFTPGSIGCRWQWILFGVAVGVFAAVCVTQQTGWIVKRQLPFALPGSTLQEREMPDRKNIYSTNEFSAADVVLAKAAAALKPTNVSIQVAAANLADSYAAYVKNAARNVSPVSYLPDHPEIAGMLQVYHAYPNSPAAASGLINNLIYRCYVLDRRELNYFGVTTRDQDCRIPDPNKHLLRDAASRAVRIDPNNAYFHTMLALSYYLSNQDSDALIEIDAASRSTKWQSYIVDNANGTRLLCAAMFGNTPCDVQFERIQSCVRFMWSDQLIQSLAEITVWKAIVLEHRGDYGAGLALRYRIARIGAIWSTSHTGGLLSTSGERLIDISAMGAGAIRDADVLYSGNAKLTPAERVENTASRFGAYLHQHGFENEQVWYAKQYEMIVKRRLLAEPVQREWSPIQEPLDTCVKSSLSLWSVGYLTLTEIVLLTCIGLVIAFAGYRDRYRNRFDAVWNSSKWRIVISAFCAVLLGAAYTTVTYWAKTLFFLAVPSIAFSVVTLYIIRHRRASVSSLFFRTASWAVLLLVLAGLCVSGMRSNLTAGYFTQFADWIPNFYLKSPLHEAYMLMARLLLLPFAIMYGAAVWSRIRYQPLNVGITAGFRTALLPVISLLLLGYCACVVRTEQCELRFDKVLNSYLDNTNRTSNR